MNPETTKQFSVGRGSIFFRLLMMHGRGLLISMGVIVVAVLIALLITNDYRCLIVGLMVVFIILPMFIALFYIRHGLKPITVMNALPHRLRFTETGLDILSRVEYTDDDEKVVKTSSRQIPYSEFDGFINGLNDVIFRVGPKGKEGILVITPDAAETKEQYMKIIDNMISAIGNQTKQSLTEKV